MSNDRIIQLHDWEPVYTVQYLSDVGPVKKIIPRSDIRSFENSHDDVVVINTESGWRCLNCDMVAFSEPPGPKTEFRHMVNGRPAYLLCGDIMVRKILGA